MLQGQSLRMLGREEESQTVTREGIRWAERILELNPIDVRALSVGSGALLETSGQAQVMPHTYDAVIVAAHRVT